MNFNVNLLRFRCASAFALLGVISVTPCVAQRPATPAPSVPIAPRVPAKIAAEGQFTDKANNKHNWQINGAHALIWDGKPYLPVGGAFTPHSFTDSSEAAWQSDVRALDILQSRGVQDVLLWPDKPLCDLPAPTMQRVLNYLDAKGFRYGVAWGPGMTQITGGYVVKPSVYRKDARPNTNADPVLTTDWITSNSDKGVVFMYDGASDSKIFREPFEISTREGFVSVPVEAPLSIAHPYVMLLPHKTLPASEQGALPDVWSGYDNYRDRVLHFASQIKWGPGLRFFLDPLARHVGLGGENSFLVPDSPAYRLEWESFLARKYANPEEARNKWALMDRFTSFAQLARLVPLWAYGRGCPYFYDPQTHRVHRMLEGSQSALNSLWWNDFIAHRDSGIAYYLNTLADVMKRQVANVPVVYTWTPSTTFLTNTSKDGGMDGLATATRPGEPSRIARNFGPAYSQSEQATRTSWFLTSEIAASPQPPAVAQVQTASLTNAPPAAPASSTYANKTAFARDLDDMRRIGSKGFFVSSLQSAAQVAEAASSTSRADWLQSPDSLTWLGEYANTLRNENGGNQRPRVLYYPQYAPGPAHTGFVPGAPSVYWLPGAYAGEELDWWPSFQGYSIKRTGDEPASVVLTSLMGTQKAHFTVQNTALVRAYNAEGTPQPVKATLKNEVEILLGPAPTLIQFDSDVTPVPREAAFEMTVQLDTMFEIAKLQKVFGAENSRLAVEQTKDYLEKKNYGQSYFYGRSQLDKLAFDAAPYIWLEGESDDLPLFTELATHPEASMGGYRRLSTPNPPLPQYGYKARYAFNTTHDGIYQIWLAGTVPGLTVSPIKWHVNNEADRDIADPMPRGPLYLNDYFGWTLLGTAKLAKGEQKLVIDVTDPAQATHEYTFAIDALMITDKPFVPNATIRPRPVDEVARQDAIKQKRTLNPKPHYAP